MLLGIAILTLHAIFLFIQCSRKKENPQASPPQTADTIAPLASQQQKPQPQASSQLPMKPQQQQPQPPIQQQQQERLEAAPIVNESPAVKETTQNNAPVVQEGSDSGKEGDEQDKSPKKKRKKHKKKHKKHKKHKKAQKSDDPSDKSSPENNKDKKKQHADYFKASMNPMEEPINEAVWGFSDKPEDACPIAILNEADDGPLNETQEMIAQKKEEKDIKGCDFSLDPKKATKSRDGMSAEKRKTAIKAREKGSRDKQNAPLHGKSVEKLAHSKENADAFNSKSGIV